MGFDVIKDPKKECRCEEQILVDYKNSALGTILMCRQCFMCYKAVDKIYAHEYEEKRNLWEKLFWRSLWYKFK